MSKTIYIGGRLESKEKGNVVTGANAILDDTKGKKQNVINKETDDELLRLEQSKQDNLTFDNAPTEDSTNPVTSGGVYTAEKALSDAIEAILLLIPSAATALNKLVDTNTMNSSISTATATFRGTYNAVSDLGLTYQATHAQIEAALDALGLTADNNDFAFVQIPVSDQSQDIAKTERFKFNGTNWLYEYDLNTSGFTAAQWAAINSGITVALVTKLTDLPTAAALQLALNAKQNTLTFDNEPTALSQNPATSGGIYTAIQAVVTALGGRLDTLEGLIPSEASSSNKLTDKAYVDGLIQAITELIPAEADTTNQLADKAYVLAQILATTPAFKGQFVTLAELQAVASPKAGDLGIVRTKDSDGMDVFTVYQYLSNAWNVFCSLSYHPQTKPATTGTTGDYPYNGMGRVELAMNMVNTGTELAPVMVNQLTQDMFYKGAVGSRVPNTNTIFVIRYDYVLAENITIPDGCVLEFEGGSISASGNNNTITGQNTVITSKPIRIFSNIIMDGSFKETKYYLDYFANSNDDSINYKEAVSAISDIDEKATIHLANGIYNFRTQIDLNDVFDNKAYLTLYGEGEGSVINILYGSSIYGDDIDNVDYLFKRDKQGDVNNDVTITLVNLSITTPDDNSNRGFLYIPTAWTNDTYIIGVKTSKLACVFNINRAYWFRMNQCTFNGGHTQLRVIDCNSSSITNCQFRATSQDDGIAIHCTGAHGFNISGNDFSQHHIGMKFDGSLCENVNITGNYFEVGSKTQQNYELILGGSNTDQCNQFVISNNSGLHQVLKFSDAEYKQYYGVVCNGRVTNSVFNCAIGEWNAIGYSNIGHIFLGNNLDINKIKTSFASYTTTNYYYTAVSLLTSPWDNREFDKRIEQLFLNQENIIRALRGASIGFSQQTRFEVDGKIVTTGAVTLGYYFRNNYPNVRRIFNLYTGSYTGGDLFSTLSQLEYVADFDGNALTETTQMFYRTKIVQAPYFNSGSVTKWVAMFDGCTKLKYIPNYDMSAATDLRTIFRSCLSLEELPVMDLSNVTNISDAFASCQQLKNVGGFQGLSIPVSLSDCRHLLQESVLNIANSIYNWVTNPDGKTAPDTTPSVTFNSVVYDNIPSETIQIFTNKGWNIVRS